MKYGWLFLMGTLAPTMAAITVSYVSEGKKGITDLLSAWLEWKINIMYYYIALLPSVNSLLWFAIEKYNGKTIYTYMEIINITIFAVLINH